MKITTFSRNALLNNGKYEGTLSGYTVSVKVKASDIDTELSLGLSHTVTTEFETVQGVRGRVAVVVIVEDGFAVVTNDFENADGIAAILTDLRNPIVGS